MSDLQGRAVAALDLCMGCRQFVRSGEVICLHCREPLADSARRHAEALAEAWAAAGALARLIEPPGGTAAG